jgi:hypothetical protein
MIKRISAVLNLSDGFTKRPLSGNASVRVQLDGRAFVPIYKPGGWFVFINLPPGEHELAIFSPKFLPQKLRFTLEDGMSGYVERYLRLKPSPQYPYGRGVQTMRIRVRASGKPCAGVSLLLAGGPGEVLKIAEDGAEKGREKLKLFAASWQRAAAYLPGHFLIEDGAKSEVCALRECDPDGVCTLGLPLENAHKRGAALTTVDEYISDENGELFLALNEDETPHFLYASRGAYKICTPKMSEKDGYILEL